MKSCEYGCGPDEAGKPSQYVHSGFSLIPACPVHGWMVGHLEMAMRDRDKALLSVEGLSKRLTLAIKERDEYIDRSAVARRDLVLAAEHTETAVRERDMIQLSYDEMMDQRDEALRRVAAAEKHAELISDEYEQWPPLMEAVEDRVVALEAALAESRVIARVAHDTIIGAPPEIQKEFLEGIAQGVALLAKTELEDLQ